MTFGARYTLFVIPYTPAITCFVSTPTKLYCNHTNQTNNRPLNKVVEAQRMMCILFKQLIKNMVILPLDIECDAYCLGGLP